jgi:hypothetical protein
MVSGLFIILLAVNTGPFLIDTERVQAILYAPARGRFLGIGAGLQDAAVRTR